MKTIHSIDQQIMEGTKKPLLLRDICENLKKVKGYGFAWIGKLEGKKLFPVVGCSEEEDFPKKIRSLKIKMPEILAVQKKKILYGKIPFKYNEFEQWNNLCQEFDFSSFCFIPIRLRKTIWGVLSLYAFNTEFFEKDERNFLEEISSEIGIALYSMELKEEEKKQKKS